MQKQELVSMKEMARRLNVGYRTMQRLVYDGQVPFVIVRSRRRFDPKEVFKALKKRTEEKQGEEKEEDVTVEQLKTIRDKYL